MFSAIAKPFGWLMMGLYDLLNNYGLALIAFALIVKIILLPFQMKSKRGSMRQARLMPKMKEIEKKHGANKQKYLYLIHICPVRSLSSQLRDLLPALTQRNFMPVTRRALRTAGTVLRGRLYGRQTIIWRTVKVNILRFLLLG